MATKISDALPRDLRYEPTGKWVRAQHGGETVVDSKHAQLVWKEKSVVPGYAFPRDDVRLDRLPDGAAWECSDPDLEGYVAVHFSALDHWFEEDEPVVGHPRDPFHRVDVRKSSRHVVVEIDGECVADSRRPHLLFETRLPTRYYLPQDDVRMEMLEPSDRTTYCAYKGEATYWSVGRRHKHIAWTYAEPLTDSQQIAGLIAFFNERCDITVDGEPVGRPKTQWT
jgi:uncharacterized protein (DUF427 family)